jgi:hypothetical protein
VRATGRTDVELVHGRIASGCASIALLVVVTGTACGGGSSSGSDAAVPASFRSKALAVCKIATAQKKALGPFPYPDFNPTRPDWSKYPGVARALTQTPVLFRTWQRNMQALGEPSTGRPAWDDLLAAIAAHVRIATEQQAAAARHDSDTFTKDYYEGSDTVKEVLRASGAAGVPACADMDR